MTSSPLSSVLSVGDVLHPGRYALLAVHRRSRVYATPSRQRLLFAVAPSIGPGPLNLVLPDPHALPDAFLLDALPSAPRYRSAAPVPLAPPRRRTLAVLLRTRLPRLAPPDSLATLAFPSLVPPPATAFQRHRDAFLAPHLSPLLRAFGAPAPSRPSPIPHIRAFRGCGAGLTPSGDDFLDGLFLARRLLGLPPAPGAWLRAARTANPLSNAFLALAADARVHAPMLALLASPSPDTLLPVLRFGHTSGADLLCALALLL